MIDRISVTSLPDFQTLFESAPGYPFSDLDNCHSSSVVQSVYIYEYARNNRELPLRKNIMASTLGLTIRSRRKALGLSQEELGFRSDLHRTYVADLERGSRNPSLKSIAKLARALEISLSDLFTNIRKTPGSFRSKRGNGSEHSPWNGQFTEILLVEDNDYDAELTIQALKKCNLSNLVHRVSDGYKALDFIFRAGAHAKRQPIMESLVVLLDLNLPGLDGLEVLKRIKSDLRTRTIPVIILTVSRQEKDLRESHRLGADDYIVKPVDFEQFGTVMPRVGLHWLLLQQQPDVARGTTTRTTRS